jgi:phage N-6-adenine-methyltransferase
MSKRQDWATPPTFIPWIEDKLGVKFELDAAASFENHKAPCFWTIEDDSLIQNWWGHVWLNPPFGRELPKFVNKALEEIEERHCKSITLLVPARTDTAWAHQLFNSRHMVRCYFIKGRFNFRYYADEAAGNAPFPSMLIHLRYLPIGRGRKNKMKPLDIPASCRGLRK